MTGRCDIPQKGDSGILVCPASCGNHGGVMSTATEMWLPAGAPARQTAGGHSGNG